MVPSTLRYLDSKTSKAQGYLIGLLSYRLNQHPLSYLNYPTSISIRAIDTIARYLGTLQAVCSR